MALSAISGSRFKKMVMKATGTQGYMSSSVQKTVRQMGAQKHFKDTAKVSRQQATKVMKALKDAGLAHKAGTTATKFVNKSFAQEERRQETIKRQNIATRTQEITAEKAAAEQKQSGNASTTQSSSAAVPAAGGTIPTVQAVASNEFVGNSYGSTNLKPLSELPKAVEKPKAWVEEEANIEDLAID